MCHAVAMRVHISLDDELVAELDRRVGRRRRSAFIGQTVRKALEDERRWEDIEAALAALPATGHDWDDDPSAWVRAQRHSDARRVG
jgi:metal-responsive CopG/Arc/MetJ family transcriptional regulator